LSPPPRPFLMIGLIWNCQGLGNSSKVQFLKELIRDEKIDFIGLQETQRSHFSYSWLASLAGSKPFAWFSAPPNGRSGGLLVGFNTDVFDVRENEIGEFMIRTLILHREQNLIWNFVNVYGAAQKENKGRLLCELSSFCSRSRDPLLVGGDFNIIRKAEKKNKPGGVNKWSFLFNSIIEQNGLVEFDLNNRLFTWSNNRIDPTFEKLDRFLASREWDLAYNNINVRGLNRSFSDHVPLCIQTDVIPIGSRVFKYELCWKDRPDFHKKVIDNWSIPVKAKGSIDIWKTKIKRLKQMLKGWNINVEGHYKK
jgi:exonuclease III